MSSGGLVAGCVDRQVKVNGGGSGQPGGDAVTHDKQTRFLLGHRPLLKSAFLLLKEIRWLDSPDNCISLPNVNQRGIELPKRKLPGALRAPGNPEAWVVWLGRA